MISPPCTHGTKETPPRTWRRPYSSHAVVTASRNTSTDVEKTLLRRSRKNPSRKHLHGRGEDVIDALKEHADLETPPRTWRRLKLGDTEMKLLGNTSTDVEKTFASVIYLLPF